MRRMVDILRGSVAFACIALNTVFWCLPVYLLGIVRSMLPRQPRIAVGSAMFRMMDGWVCCMHKMANLLRIVRIDEQAASAVGAPVLRQDGWYLVVGNHQSWADILVLVFALNGRIPQCKFFIKRQLIWVPFIGVALRLLGFPAMRRYSRERLQAEPALRERDRETIRKACADFRERPTSVLNFVEGTRFTVAKHAAQQSPYRTLLKPKVGGFAMVLEHLGDKLDAIVDVAIVYDTPTPPSFWDFLCGRCARVHLRVRTLAPPAQTSCRDWLDNLWAEKDAYLSSCGLSSSGTWPAGRS